MRHVVVVGVLGLAALGALAGVGAGPVDCSLAAKTVTDQIAKSDAGPEEERGRQLWIGRQALRDAFRLPDLATAECWVAAGKLAIRAGDRELAAYAIEAILRLKPAEDQATLLQELAALADREFVARIPKERAAFVEAMKKAEAGDAASMTAVGEKYTEGLGVPADDEYAVVWYQAATDKGHAFGTIRLGQRKMAGVGIKQDKPAGFALFKKIAERDGKDISKEDLALASYIVGGCYLQGEGVAVNGPLAFEWTLKAAELGYVDAMSAAGTHYRNGTGTPKDLVKAVAMFERAAAKDDATSMVFLGTMYMTGEGVKADMAVAERWLIKAAASPEIEFAAHAAALLGALYLDGSKVEKDPAKAFKYTKQSYDQGNVLAAYVLGMIYVRGDGVEKDAVKGVALYREAADAGSHAAMFTLYGAYAAGVGVEKDAVEAQKWLERAAAAGNPTAKETLATQKK